MVLKKNKDGIPLVILLLHENQLHILVEGKVLLISSSPFKLELEENNANKDSEKKQKPSGGISNPKMKTFSDDNYTIIFINKLIALKCMAIPKNVLTVMKVVRRTHSSNKLGTKITKTFI